MEHGARSAEWQDMLLVHRFQEGCEYCRYLSRTVRLILGLQFINSTRNLRDRWARVSGRGHF